MDVKRVFEKILDKLHNRRGFEWSQGKGDNDAGWRDGESRPPSKPVTRRTWFLIAFTAALVFFIIFFPKIAWILTDFYWYRSLGYESVFLLRLGVMSGMMAAGLVISFLIYFLNWKAALDNVGAVSGGVSGDVWYAQFSSRVVLLAALLLAMVEAVYVKDLWFYLLNFLNGVPFGETDPLFGKDIGFYVFKLPFLVFLHRILKTMLTISFFGCLMIYLFTQAVTFQPGRFVPELEMLRRARFHLTLLGAAILVVWGLGYRLDRYSLLFSPTGVVYGAGYTDVAVVLPALNILTFAAFAAAALLCANFFRPRWKLSLAAVAVLLITGWFSRSMLPALVQQYRVKPNEYDMEKEFIAYNLDHTRRGFGLNDITTVSITPDEQVTAEDLLADQETVRNIRLWDYAPLLKTYNQLQAIRTYYDFPDVFIDRYELGGRNRQVILSVRELDLSQLQNRTWVNSHLEFTHGYGVVMNPVNEVAPGGLPNFFMKDVPTSSAVDIRLDRPEIYYGTKQDSYVLVKTAVKEFDYPMGNSNVRSTYEGDSGVWIGSLWRRFLFALRFRDSEILFTNSLGKDSRVLFNRNAQRMLVKLAPFMIYDQDIYPVIYDGRILWAQDCFAHSDSYPYSAPFLTNDATLLRFYGINYVRNSVKATVDAYTGEAKLYLVDPGDPVAATWKKIFPRLFTDGEDMPQGLRSHMRYPENLFEVQTEVYRTYHMSDPNTYYNREDVWEVTPAGRGRRIQPNYVTMKLWGGEDPEFAIIVPYMPLGRDNLIGWMAGRCDPRNYGELLVYEFPKQKLIYGPAQIEALIDQNPEISAQLSLWGQHGSDVIRGDLLVIPIGNSLLYVQPLYIKAERGELPELKRVIVSTGGRVAWDETFGGALELLVSARVTDDIDVPPARNGAAAAAEAPAGTAGTEAAALAVRAQELYDSAIKAQREGDWVSYGNDIKKLREILSELEEKLR